MEQSKQKKNTVEVKSTVEVVDGWTTEQQK